MYHKNVFYLFSPVDIFDCVKFLDKVLLLSQHCLIETSMGVHCCLAGCILSKSFGLLKFFFILHSNTGL